MLHSSVSVQQSPFVARCSVCPPFRSRSLVLVKESGHRSAHLATIEISLVASSDALSTPSDVDGLLTLAINAFDFCSIAVYLLRVSDAR